VCIASSRSVHQPIRYIVHRAHAWEGVVVSTVVIRATDFYATIGRAGDQRTACPWLHGHADTPTR